MRTPTASVLLAVISAGSILPVLPARADTRDDRIQQLLDRVEALEKEVRELQGEKAKLKSAPPDSSVNPVGAPAAQPPAPERAATTGPALTVSDEVKAIRLRGLLQLDSRDFFHDATGNNNNSFLVRRARFYVEGALAHGVDFVVAPDFAGSAFTLMDANMNIAFDPGLQLRVGRFKPPVGLEVLQSDSWAFMVERSIATNLMPARDQGIMLWGDVWGGKLSYAAAILNGVADGATISPTGDFDDKRDLALRVYAQPFNDQKSSPLYGLGFGVGASVGWEGGAQALTSGYRTDGQQVFFRYRSTVAQDGELWRVTPQAAYYHGPVGGMAEYVVSTVNLRPNAGGAKAELKNHAWQLAGSYVLTGDDASYKGVVPRRPLNPSAGAWGAWEITGRISKLDVDNAAFPLFADPATSASEETGWGVGVNWYPTKSVRASINYFHTSFDLAAPTVTNPVILQDENAVLTRFQLNF